MRGAAALLLIIGESHRTALSAKLFDYLEVRRPILGYGPPGCDAENLLKHCGVGTWASDQIEAVDALFRIAEGKDRIRPDEDALKGYSADVMAERTADLLMLLHQGLTEERLTTLLRRWSKRRTAVPAGEEARSMEAA